MMILTGTNIYDIIYLVIIIVFILFIICICAYNHYRNKSIIDAFATEEDSDIIINYDNIKMEENSKYIELMSLPEFL
jgi:hypothetical protein